MTTLMRIRIWLAAKLIGYRAASLPVDAQECYANIWPKHKDFDEANIRWILICCYKSYITGCKIADRECHYQKQVV